MRLVLLSLWHAITQVGRILVTFSLVTLLVLGLLAAAMIGTGSGRSWLAGQALWVSNRYTDWQILATTIESPSLTQWSFGSLRVFAPNQPDPILNADDLQLSFPLNQWSQGWRLDQVGARYLTLDIARWTDMLAAGSTAETSATPGDTSAGSPFTPEQKLSLGQLNIAELKLAWSGQPGQALRGSVTAHVDWLPGKALPTGDLNWTNQGDTLLALNLRENQPLWELNGEVNLPLDSWAHELSRWPLDESVSARLEAALDPEQPVFQIKSLVTPWMGYQVSLSGALEKTSPATWRLNAGRLQADDLVSRLSGQWAPDDTWLEGSLNLPLALFDPWLPATLKTHPEHEDDRLRADITWPLNGAWELDGQVNSHWHNKPATIELEAQGQALHMQQSSGLVVAGNSGLAFSGDWHLLQQTGELQIAADLQHALLAPYWQQSWLQAVRLTGTLSGRGRTRDGAINWPTWEGRAQARGRAPPAMAEALPTLNQWSATALTHWSQPNLSWTKLTATAQHQNGDTLSLSSSGALDLNKQGLDFSWQLAPQGLTAWIPGLPDDISRLEVGGSGRVSGPWLAPAGSAQLHADADWRGEPLSVQINAPQVSSDQILLNQIDASWRKSRLSGAITLQPNSAQPWQEWPVQADLSPLALSLSDLAEQIAPWPDALSSGEVLSSLSIRGPLGDPAIVAQSRINADYLDKNLTGSVNWQDDRIQADINWQDRYLRLRGQGRPWETGQWDIQADRLQTRDLLPWIDIPQALLNLEATHSLDLQIQGNVERLQLSLHSQHAGTWRAAPLTLDLTGTTTLIAGQPAEWAVTSGDLGWRSARVNLQAASQTPDWRPEQASIHVNTLPLGTLLERPDLDATLTAGADLEAHWPAWELSPQVQIQGKAFNDELNGKLAATLTGRNRQLQSLDFSELSLASAAGALLGTQGGLQNGQWNLVTDWQALDWAPPESWPVPSDSWRGDGEIRLHGPARNPDISAFMNWRTQWENPTQDGRQALTFATQLGSSDDTQALTTSLETPQQTLFQAGLEWPRQAWSQRLQTDWQDWPFTAWWETQAPLEQLVYWSGQDQLQAYGNLQGQGLITGPWRDLALDNQLLWENGRLRVPQTNAELDNLDLRLELASRERIQVTGSARAGDGRLTLDGSLGLQDGLTPDFQVQLKDAALLQRLDVQSTASGNLGLTRDPQGWLVAGDLRLGGLTVALNRLSNDSIPQLDIAPDDGQAGDTASAVPLRFDVQLATEGTATIRGNGLDAQLAGELRLTGPVSQLNSDGAMTVESGTFNLLTRRFNLVEGELRLVDDAINVNLLAVHKRGDTEIEARLTGNNETIRLQLQSQPALPEDEIVAQLLFGKTVQNMTPWQALQLASAVNQLRGGESVDLLLATRESLGLDTLEIAPAEGEDDAQSLRVGRYLNSRVYLEVDTELTEEQDWQGSLEVELTPNLNLETFTGTGGRGGGLELQWRRDY